MPDCIDHPKFTIRAAALLSCAIFLVTSRAVFAQSCGTHHQQCTSNAACDDGDPCNGTETCPPGIIRFCTCDPTPPCDDGNLCTVDLCSETPRGIVCDHNSGGCSDSVFCNGVEFCLHGGSCTAGSPPCDKPLMCDEANDRCVECFNDGHCADANPCTADTCNVASGVCEHIGCANLFCDGRQLCRGACLPGASPCTDPNYCDEANNTCGECNSDLDCIDEDPCTTATCYLGGHACRVEPCLLAFDSPAEGTIFKVGDEVDVEIAGRGSRGLDLNLVLDESGSINSDDFVRLKNFAKNLVNSFPFHGNATGTGTRVGVVTFSTGSRRILNMSANKNNVLNAIQNLSQAGGSTCIGCGIDDGVENWYSHGRRDSSRVMVVVTDGLNNQPLSGPAVHLAGALQAADFHGQTIVAVGVGDANFNEIEQIATEIPGVQTAFYANSFSQLATLLNSIVLVAGNGTATAVEITLPDGTEQLTPVNSSGNFSLGWKIVPGENQFTGRIPTPYGDLTATLTLMGVCSEGCGDLNASGTVDLRDLAQFLNCFGHRSWDLPACACTDLQGDTQIDLVDHAAITTYLEIPPSGFSPHCDIP